MTLSRQLSILVLEDEAITARHLRRVLEKLGYHVVGVVANGQAALLQIAGAAPDLLLADVGIDGDMDGVEVARLVRERWNIPTVFLTAYSDVETMQRARGSQAYGFLVKPFADQELHATIEIALHQNGLAADREQRAQATSHLLVRTQEELSAVTARLFSVQEEERERVARDLHDDVGQRLGLLQIELEVLWKALPASFRNQHKPAFTGALSRIGELLRSLREISHRLHPSILDHLGLPAAIRQLCDEFQKGYATPTRFSVRDVPAVIPSQISLNIYRIVQEALQNIAKHAGPATVNIALIATPGSLDLSIRDTGRGFDAEPGKAGNGLGLISMAQRARSLGGNLEIQSYPERGTHLRVSVPLGSMTD
ncbi:MAG TPA: response regulator [Bryobacteraceae bacterium]|nr:response regulator [Bryobacteraceae bacterium]